MLFLREKEVDLLLSSLSAQECHSLLSSLLKTLQLYTASKHVPSSDRQVQQPSREVIVSEKGYTTLFMPCSLPTSTGIKIVTASHEGVKGCINVFAPNGELCGLVHAEELTAFRTSLAVMIAFLRFPQRISEIVVFGAGKQAQWHIRLALLFCPDLTHITVMNRTSSTKLDWLVSDVKLKYPSINFDTLLKTRPDIEDQLQKVLATADAIFCCTPASEPHFPYSYIGKSKPRFISLIGSYTPFMEEIDTETLRSGGVIYVDSKEQCLAEAGELIKAGVRSEELFEIGELSSLRPTGAANSNHVFKCVGLAVMDIVMAQELLQMAPDKGLGLDIARL